MLTPLLESFRLITRNGISTFMRTCALACLILRKIEQSLLGVAERGTVSAQVGQPTLT